jgi:hypothetical protein
VFIIPVKVVVSSWFWVIALVKANPLQGETTLYWE